MWLQPYIKTECIRWYYLPKFICWVRHFIKNDFASNRINFHCEIVIVSRHDFVTIFILQWKFVTLTWNVPTFVQDQALWFFIAISLCTGSKTQETKNIVLDILFKFYVLRPVLVVFLHGLSLIQNHGNRSSLFDFVCIIIVNATWNAFHDNALPLTTFLVVALLIDDADDHVLDHRSVRVFYSDELLEVRQSYPVFKDFFSGRKQNIKIDDGQFPTTIVYAWPNLSVIDIRACVIVKLQKN